jgi:hypothetical protein
LLFAPAGQWALKKIKKRHFNGVFKLLMQRNGQKRDKKNRRKKTAGTGKQVLFSQLFWQKVT